MTEAKLAVSHGDSAKIEVMASHLLLVLTGQPSLLQPAARSSDSVCFHVRSVLQSLKVCLFFRVNTGFCRVLQLHSA